MDQERAEPEQTDQAEQVDNPPAEDNAPETGGAREVETSDAERLARSRGWKPGSEWHGDRPEGFIDDPAEYNRRHEENNPRLRADNIRLHHEIDELKRISQQNFDMLRSSKDAEIKRLRDDVQRRMRAAAENADMTAFDTASRELQALDATSPPPAQPAPAQQPTPAPYNPDADRDFRSWHQDNAWYGTDAGRTQFAEQVAVQAVRQRGLTPQMGRVYYDAIGREVANAFGPVAQRNPPRQQAGTAAPSAPKKNTFASIPAEDQKNFRDILVKKFSLYTDDAKGREEYAAAYFHEKGD